MYRFIFLFPFLLEWIYFHVNFNVIGSFRPRLQLSRPEYGVEDRTEREDRGRYEERNSPRLPRLLQVTFHTNS